MWDIEFLILKRLYQENAKTQFFTKAAFKTIFEKGKEFNNHQRENPFETIDNFYSRDKFLSTVGDAPPKDEQSQYFLNDRGKIAYKIESD